MVDFRATTFLAYEKWPTLRVTMRKNLVPLFKKIHIRHDERRVPKGSQIDWIIEDSISHQISYLARTIEPSEIEPEYYELILSEIQALKMIKDAIWRIDKGGRSYDKDVLALSETIRDVLGKTLSLSLDKGKQSS